MLRLAWPYFNRIFHRDNALVRNLYYTIEHWIFYPEMRKMKIDPNVEFSDEFEQIRKKPGFLETIAKMPGFGMASEGPLAYSFGPNLHARRTKPCSVRVRIAPIPRKGSQRLQSCRSQRSSRTIAPTRDKRVLVVTTRPIVTNSPIGRCTIWGILTHGVRVISWSPIRNTTVRNVARTSPPTSLISRHRAAALPTA